MREAFCLECEERTPYKIVTKVDKIFGNKFKNGYIEYIEKTAICTKCGCEMYVPKINDENIKARLEAFEKEKALDN